MNRHLVAVALVAGLALAAACGSDHKGTTEPPPGPPSDTGDTALPPADTVVLQIAGTVGKPTFPDGNTAQGGQGEPVDGIECGTMAGDNYHIHVHLSLYVNGEQLAIPKAIGVVKPAIANGFVIGADANGGCFYWVHTHDASGIIHVEPPTTVEVRLGELFDLWGQPLSSTGVAGYSGAVTVFVDGKKYTDDPRDILFEAHKQIAIEVGTPIVTPDFYIFPQDY
ncbi:MAG TPA: hypothetical protein VFK39_04670 [Gemmatimonadaceae bacterium]|nr:hypothetical protein [Gemmatimonadaceae bacterium]